MAIITGTADNDLLTGTALDDEITGLEGSDTLLGGRGADLMSGGDGDDTYRVDNVSDQTIETEGAAAGIDVVIASVSWTLADQLENLRLDSAVAIDGTGNALDNTIIAGSGDNRVDGAGGIDTVSYFNAVAAVTVRLDTGTAQATGGSGSDTLIDIENVLGSQGFGDDLTGSALANTLRGAGGNDTLSGLGGNDTIDGGAGADQMRGGEGDDTYVVDNAGDAVSESAAGGIDTIRSARAISALAFNVENALLLGSANLKAVGNARDNMLTGNAGNNFLNGAAGADTLEGGAGNDIYRTDGLDKIVESDAADAGIDTVRAALDLTLGGNLENLELLDAGGAISGVGNELANRILGNLSKNALTGKEGEDTLEGGDSNDTLDGGTGADRLAGGTGDDTYDGVESVDTVLEEAGGGRDLVNTAALSFALPDEVEDLDYTGALKGFFGTGNALANELRGADDTNDTLDGAAGADTLIGGSGDDVYVVDDAFDEVGELSGGGVDEVRTSLDRMTLPDFAESLRYIGAGSFAGTGGAGADMIVGAADSDTLDGRAGNDTLDGGTGNDSLLGGLGNDRYLVDSTGDIVLENVILSTEIDTVVASASFALPANVENLTLTGTAAIAGSGNSLANVLVGNSGNNTLEGVDGNDSLAGGTGTDSLVGGGGNDTLDGGSDADTLVGSTGNDLYIVRSAANVVIETTILVTDIDAVQSSVEFALPANIENLALTGSAAIDGSGNSLANTITGNAAANVLTGLGGSDTISGSDGNDLLSGGFGADNLVGGVGADRFLFDSLTLDSLAERDLLPDFVSGSDDLVFDNSVFQLDNDADLLADALVRASPGGWSASSELVIFTANAASVSSAASVIATLGAATTAIGIGDRKLFVVDNGVSSAVWLFRSDDGNSSVASTELSFVAVLTAPALSAADFLFVA